MTGDGRGVEILGFRLPELCALRRFAQGSCPGCGLTRSFALGVRGDPAAFQMNPAGPLLLAAVAAQIPYRLLRLRRRRADARAGLVDLTLGRPGRAAVAVRHGLVAALVAQWIVRLLYSQA